MTTWAHAYPIATVLLINLLALAAAYTVIYPPVAGSTRLLALRTLLVDSAALVISAGLFWGSGVAFLVMGVDVGWLIFALGSLIAMELPLVIAFIGRHGWPKD
jgi:hypothetical protein